MNFLFWRTFHFRGWVLGDLEDIFFVFWMVIMQFGMIIMGRAGCPVAGCPIKLDVRKAGCPVELDIR